MITTGCIGLLLITWVSIKWHWITLQLMTSHVFVKIDRGTKVKGGAKLVGGQN